MGEMNLPQGPHRHCGLLAGHPKHSNITPVDGSYCDGVTPLGPLLELVVRVPLVEEMSMDGATHEEVLACILEEGLQTYAFEELTSSRTRVALRLRWGGEDRVYPLVPDGDYALKVKDDSGQQ